MSMFTIIFALRNDNEFLFVEKCAFNFSWAKKKNLFDYNKNGKAEIHAKINNKCKHFHLAPQLNLFSAYRLRSATQHSLVATQKEKREKKNAEHSKWSHRFS